TESSLWERTMPGSVAIAISSASLKSTSVVHSSKSTSPFAGAGEGSADGATGADRTTVLSAAAVSTGADITVVLSAAGVSAARAVVAVAAAAVAAAAGATAGAGAGAGAGAAAGAAAGATPLMAARSAAAKSWPVWKRWSASLAMARARKATSVGGSAGLS